MEMREFDASEPTSQGMKIFVWGKEVEYGIFAYMANEPSVEVDGYVDITSPRRYIDSEGNFHFELWRLHGRIRWERPETKEEYVARFAREQQQRELVAQDAMKRLLGQE